MVLVDRYGWEAERVQGGYRYTWQRNRDGKVRAVGRNGNEVSTANAAVSLVVVEAEVGYEILALYGP